MNDEHTLNKTLNRLSQVYNLPHFLKESSSVLNSTTYLDTYQSLILPTHAIINNTNNSDINNEIDYSESKLEFDDNNNDFDTNLDAESSLKHKHNENSTIIIGHCIVNNGGILLNNLSKIPSYQWGFKHEDETVDNSALSNNNVSITNGNDDNSINNVNNNNIFSGLSEYRATTIPSLPGNVTTTSSGGLNSRMNRLPIMNKHTAKLINNYDLNNYLSIPEGNESIIQGGKERNLMNGLPYYNANLIEKQIRYMNIIKKSDFKASNTNTSWFSNMLNQTIDDVEYLHGEVILNQFITNKRVIRNYQWDLYWYDQMNNTSFDDQGQSLKDFNFLNSLKTEKMKEIQREKAAINAELVNLNSLKQKRREEFITKATESGKFFDHNKLAETLQDCEDLLIEYVNGNDDESAEKVTIKDLKPMFDIYGEDLLNSQMSLMKRSNQIIDSLDEVVISKEEFEEYKSKQPNQDLNDMPQHEEHGTNKSLIYKTRFASNKEFIQDNEIIIEREIPTTDPKLIEMEARLQIRNGINKSRFLQSSSKIVKIKRTPNPNSIGFSNIKSRKPSFL